MFKCTGSIHKYDYLLFKKIIYNIRKGKNVENYELEINNKNIRDTLKLFSEFKKSEIYSKTINNCIKMIV